MKKMLPLLFIALFLGLGSCSKDTDGPLPENVNASALEQEVLDLVNDHRTSIGLAPLRLNASANEAADTHNDYMISKGALSHDNFSKRASDLSSKVSAEMIAENVAKGFNTGNGAFQEWMESNGHRLNIESNFTHTGISVKQNANGEYYFTQLFYR